MIIGYLSPRSSILKINMHPVEHFAKEMAISLSNLMIWGDAIRFIP